ncbi:MAG: transaldolase family protein [Bacillota bacterium]
MEIWWDSSPLVFSHWAQGVANEAGEDRPELLEQLHRLYDTEAPGKSFFKGVTTNPRLTAQIFSIIPDQAFFVVDHVVKSYPGVGTKRLAFEVYKEVTKLGAKMYLDKFEYSGFLEGYVSAQVDPRLIDDTKTMVEQGIILHSLSPNIMIKVPGSKAGIHAILLLTALGIPTNATLVFTVSQIMQVAMAVKKGLEIGRQNGLDFSKWRSVITIMVGRFEENPQFAEQASQLGIELDERLKRWAGIANAKKAYRLLTEGDYPSKLLLASTRVSPKVDGRQEIWHLEKLAGASLVFTLYPDMVKAFLLHYAAREIPPKIDQPVPVEVMATLKNIPYFAEGYDEKGIAPEDFINHPATIYTYNEFCNSMKELENYVENRVSPQREAI